MVFLASLEIGWPPVVCARNIGLSGFKELQHEALFYIDTVGHVYI
jgi:hypothetical protein